MKYKMLKTVNGIKEKSREFCTFKKDEIYDLDNILINDFKSLNAIEEIKEMNITEEIKPENNSIKTVSEKQKLKHKKKRGVKR